MGDGFRIWTTVVVAAVAAALMVAAQPQVPCYFIFGDSLVDNGNNNYIQSLARANYLPYGIDFPGGPTGRFCNGKTTVDVIAELLGFEDYIPPYATAGGQDVLRGVNYASAAVGIRQETGRQLGARIDFTGQVSNYKNTVAQIVDILGNEDEASKYLSRCIYSIGMGSNDYLNNYFLPLYYHHRATVVLSGTIRRYSRPTIFPPNKGFRLANAGCCGVGRNNGQMTCLPMQTPCLNRNEYLFWDAFHPSEAANIIIGRRSYNAEKESDAYPYDINRLAQAQL